MAPTNTQTLQHPRTVNGVDVDALKQTITTIKNNPALGTFHFRARNRWTGAAQNQSEIQSFFGAGHEDDTRTRPFVMACDEPQVLLGRDEAPNPVEYLLHALAGCITTTTAMHAAARGIEIRSISSELEGDIDIRGFLGLSDAVPRGYQQIRITMHIDSDAPPEKLSELAQYSPVLNTITHAVPVQISVTTHK